MKPDAADDDPTRALDDFVRRMRPANAPAAAAPDLSDLSARLHPERSVTAASVGPPTMSKTCRWSSCRASRPRAATALS